MTQIAVSVEDIWKNFRLYHDKNHYLKTALLKRSRVEFEQFWALKGVSFDVEHGSTFGIIGSNGSGKSTLLKCLSGILSPDRGRLDVNGRVVALLELGAGFHPELSGRENIFLNGAILGMTRSEIELKFDEIVSFSGLEKFIDTPVKNYSSGMVVRLGFAVATSVDPEILVIDEVLAVGDASFQQRCFEKIESFRQEGRTIILVSHGLSQVTQLCDRVAWIDQGQLREVGSSFEVVSNYTGISYGAAPRAEGEIGDRWGSGEAQIKQVMLLDDKGKTREAYESGKPLRIEVTYDASIPIQNAVVGLRITNFHGTPVWGTNTRRRGFDLPRIFGRGRVQFDIPELPLLEGTYEVTVALSDITEVRVFDHWERRVRFNVHQYQGFDEGLVMVDGLWSLVPE